MGGDGDPFLGLLSAEKLQEDSKFLFAPACHFLCLATYPLVDLDILHPFHGCLVFLLPGLLELLDYFVPMLWVIGFCLPYLPQWPDTPAALQKLCVLLLHHFLSGEFH
jgi:hypothetical protein